MFPVFRHAICITLIFISSTNLSGQEYWNSHSPTLIPEPRENHGAVFVPADSSIYLFAGRAGAGYLSDLWKLDLSSLEWMEVQVNSILFPSARHTPQLLYNPLDTSLLMWSGQGSGGLLNDVWQFDLSSGNWTELFPNGDVQGQARPRYGAASIFDPYTKNIINFGGFSSIGRLKDIFSFSMDSLFWTKRSLDPRPVQRCLHTGIYANDRREMYIFGGQSSGNRNDIWKMQVDSFVWTELLPPSSPTGRHFTGSIYRSPDQMVIFGGNSTSQENYSGALDDLWVFDMENEVWDTLSQGSVKPVERVGHSCTYIPGSDKMFVFGGRNPSGYLGDLWSYNFDPDVTPIIENPNITLDIKIFPNPFSSQVSIEILLEKPVSFEWFLTNISGQILVSEPFREYSSGENIIQVNSLPKGNAEYFLIVKTEEEIFVKQIVRID